MSFSGFSFVVDRLCRLLDLEMEEGRSSLADRPFQMGRAQFSLKRAASAVRPSDCGRVGPAHSTLGRLHSKKRSFWLATGGAPLSRHTEDGAR